MEFVLIIVSFLLQSDFIIKAVTTQAAPVYLLLCCLHRLKFMNKTLPRWWWWHFLFFIEGTWWRTRSVTLREEPLMNWRSWRDCESSRRRRHTRACGRTEAFPLKWRVYLNVSVLAVASTRTVSAKFQSCCFRRTKPWRDCESSSRFSYSLFSKCRPLTLYLYRGCASTRMWWYDTCHNTGVYNSTYRNIWAHCFIGMCSRAICSHFCFVSVDVVTLGRKSQVAADCDTSIELSRSKNNTTSSAATNLQIIKNRHYNVTILKCVRISFHPCCM